MLLHLSPFAGFVVPIPFANILAPMVMWLIKKDQSAFIESVGREALNFQITVTLAIVCCVVAGFATLLVGFIVLVPVMILIALADIALCIVAALAANEGREYRFPLCLRWVQGPGAGPVA